MNSYIKDKSAPSGLTYKEIQEREKPYFWYEVEKFKNTEYYRDVNERFPGKDLRTLNLIWRIELRFGKNRFDLSEVQYEGQYKNITIYCNELDEQGKIHGKIEDLPQNILNSLFGGCSMCRNEKARKDNFIWDEESCYEEAKKYIYYKDFREKSIGAYDSSKKFGWIKNYEWLIKRKLDPNKKSHCIYAYLFPDYNSVYIGLTMNKGKRDRDHRRPITVHKGTEKERDGSSAVYRFCINNNIDPKTIDKPVYIYDSLTPEEASKLEQKTENLYKENGWNVLNIAKPGSLGGNLGKWTEENTIELLKTFDSLKEAWNDKSGRSAYCTARKKGWLLKKIEDDLWPTRVQKLTEYTKENLINIAKENNDNFSGKTKKLAVARKLNCLPEIYHVSSYPGQQWITLMFNDDYTKILGKYWTTREAFSINNLPGTCSKTNIISKTLRKGVSNGYGWLREDLFQDFLQTITDENLKNSLLVDYEKSCQKFDDRIRKNCEKYKDIDLTKFK